MSVLQKNILVNPLTKVLENQSFFEFVKNYFKKYYKLLLICCAIIVAMEGLSGYINDFVGFTLISTLMIGVMVFLVCWFGIDVNKREFYNLSGNPIFQSVDSLSDIQSNSKHQVYREKNIKCIEKIWKIILSLCLSLSIFPIATYYTKIQANLSL